MNPSTREDFYWLVSDEAKPILRQVQDAFLDQVNAVRIAKSLRKKFSPNRSALIMEQAQLRIRARTKFKLANEMYFTRRGLEQASGWQLAQYKSKRYAFSRSVADVCCGVGGDLLGIAQRQFQIQPSVAASGQPFTVGVDSDELTSLFAGKNLEVNGISPELANAKQANFDEFDLSQFDGVHIDPDRRVKNKKTVTGNRFSPTMDSIVETVDPNVSLGIKVAPATPVKGMDVTQFEREWIGDHRECKQQMLWRGSVANNPGCRTATYVGKRRTSQISIPESEVNRPSLYFDELHRFIFEPHASVLAANLTDHLAERYGCRRFTSNIVYLTGDRQVEDPLLTQFEILDVVRMDLRNTVRVLKILDVGEVEVKMRGVENILKSQFARMKLEGPNKATLILTRLGKYRVAIVAKRKGNELALPELPQDLDSDPLEDTV